MVTISTVFLVVKDSNIIIVIIIIVVIIIVITALFVLFHKNLLCILYKLANYTLPSF